NSKTAPSYRDRNPADLYLRITEAPPASIGRSFSEPVTETIGCVPVDSPSPVIPCEAGRKPMHRSRGVLLAALCGLLAMAGTLSDETKVAVRGVPLCCPACIKAVAGILKSVDGVKGACDQANKTVTIIAPDVQTARKALDALAAGGFHGSTGDKSL